MTQLEITVIKTALRKMEAQGYFSISTIDNILQITKGIPDAKAYQMLRTLHCIDYKDMPKELLEELPKMISQVISSLPLNIVGDNDIFVNALAAPKTKEPSSFVKRLNFW
jgi:hypothetical protein